MGRQRLGQPDMQAPRSLPAWRGGSEPGSHADVSRQKGRTAMLDAVLEEAERRCIYIYIPHTYTHITHTHANMYYMYIYIYIYMQYMLLIYTSHGFAKAKQAMPLLVNLAYDSRNCSCPREKDKNVSESALIIVQPCLAS